MKCPYCVKVCTKCGKILIANSTNFYKQKTGKYGLASKCKACVKQYKKQDKTEIEPKVQKEKEPKKICRERRRVKARKICSRRVVMLFKRKLTAS